MGVLKNIAHRLQTDIGENLRASIDVNYSRQLTQDRFNQRAQEKKDQRDANIRIEQRRQKLQDETAKQQHALQLAAGNKLFEIARESDDWGGFLDYVDNPNLSPLVSDYMKGLANGAGSQSLEARRFNHKQKLDFAKLSSTEKRLSLDRDKYETQTEQKNAELQLKQEKLRFEKMQDLRQTNQTRNNRASMIEFIERTPDIETEGEREAFLTRLRAADASPKSVEKVWDEIMARLGDRLASREKQHAANIKASNALSRVLVQEAGRDDRFRLQEEGRDRRAGQSEQGKTQRANIAAGNRARVITDPSGAEMKLAEQGLIDSLGESFDNLDDKEKQAMISSTAFKINSLSRETGKTQTEVLQQAIDETARGLSDDPGFFSGLINRTNFSLRREAALKDLSEDDIQATMEARNMTRDQVINEWLRRQGIE